MATLTGQTIAATYDALLKVTDNGPITSSLKLITDGLGNNTALSLSNSEVAITGNLYVTPAININSSTTNDRLTLSHTGSIKAAFGVTNSGDSFLYHATSTSFPMWINSTGKFGIGTTNPFERVQIGDGSAAGGQYLRIWNSNSDIYIGQSGGTIFGLPTGTGYYILGDNASYPFAIGTTASQPFILASANTERMRITSSGNVGIGTTSPSQKLDVTGNILISGSSTSGSFIKSGGTSSQFLKADGSVDSTTYTPTSRTLTINGTSYDLSADRSWTIVAGVSSFNTRTGAITLTSLDVTDALGFTPVTNARTISTTAPLSGGGDLSANRTLSISQATTSTNGYLSSTDWNTFNNKQNALTNPITGTGTTNYVPKFTGSSALGNSIIYDSGTAIGIGTASPAATLDVNGGITSSSNIRGLRFWGGPSSFTTHSAPLHIFSSTIGTGAIARFNNNESTDASTLTSMWLENYAGYRAELAYTTHLSGSNIYINNTYSSGNILFNIAGSEKIRIASNGNVGIGTASPSSKLEVYLNDNSLTGSKVTNVSTGTGSAAITNYSNGTVSHYFGTLGSAYAGYGVLLANEGFVYTAGQSLSLAADGANSIKFGTGTGTPERMRITSTGAVGIGTSSPSNLLHLYGSGANTQTIRQESSISAANAYLVQQSASKSYITGLSTDFSNSYIIYDATASAMRLAITSAGNVGIGTASPSYQLQLSTDSAAKPTSALWTIASDSRIKENITPYSKGLKELMLINPINYDYNGLGGFKKGKGGVGIIAQEILDILPDSVSSVKGKLNESDKEEIDILNFNGHELTYVLINAIKELKAELDELKNNK
jgi:hypothetical protein